MHITEGTCNTNESLGNTCKANNQKFRRLLNDGQCNGLGPKLGQPRKSGSGLADMSG